MRLAYLEKIDPARRMSRFYTICVTPTLFGQWAVVREWGRIGQAGAVRENWLESESAASAAGTKVIGLSERIFTTGSLDGFESPKCDFFTDIGRLLRRPKLRHG